MDSNSQFPTNGDPSIAPTSVSGKSDLLRIGPVPHLILKTSEIEAQRLRKKIRKLIEQRDHWKSEFDKLSYILRLFPYSQAIKERQRTQELSEKLKRLSNYDTMVPLLVSENERLKAENEKIKASTLPL